MTFLAELHLHSCLSSDTQFSMNPESIVKALANRKTGLACLCDFNSALNIPAFAIHAKKHSLASLFGIEVICAEGCTLLCMFNDPLAAVELGSEIYNHLPEKKSSAPRSQLYVDEKGGILGCVEKELTARCDIGIQDLEREVHKNGGLVIPSAVDGEKHSLVSQFGKIIKGKWDALEFLHPEHAGKMLMENYPVLPFSKPEFLDQLGERGIKLSTGDLPLLHSDGKVNLQAVYKAFEKRRVIAEEN